MLPELGSKDIAAAAQCLAELEAQVQKSGPLEKRATFDFSALANDPAVRQALQNAAIGAGVGGVGGLALGAFGDRKKNPWTTATTGALLGAGAGGLGTALYHSYNNIGPTQTPEQIERTFQNEWHANKLLDTVGQPRFYDVAVRGAGASNAPNPVQQLTRGAGAAGYAGMPLDYVGGHPLSSALGAGAAGRAAWTGAHNYLDDRLHHFDQGVDAILKRKPEMANYLYPHLQDSLAHAQSDVKLQEGSSLLSKWRANRALSRAMATGSTTGTGLHAGTQQAATIRDALNTGRRIAKPIERKPKGKLMALAALASLLGGAFTGR